MPILTDIPIDQYHQSEVLSKTKLCDFDAFGPEDYKARHVDRSIPGRSSDALRFGRLYDGLCDNEERERARWAPVLPGDAPRRPTPAQKNAKKPSEETVAAVAWWDKWNAMHGGKEEVSADERARLDDMLGAFRRNSFAAGLWDLCQRQVTIRRELPALGVSLQSRPDGLCLGTDQPFLADIKTTHDLRGFARDAIAFGYHLQLAIGQWLLAQEGHQVDAYLIVVESKLRPRCKVFTVPEVALAAGWTKCKELTEEIARRIRDNDWTDTQAAIEELELPKWQVKQLEEVAG
jgi:hypothetical protein